MNVYLMVDIEGISGIYAREQVIPTEAKFSEGRRFMTDDINACAKGLKEAVAKFKDMKPYVVSKPVEIKFEVTERTALPRMIAHEGLEHIDGRTVKVTADTVEKALMRAMVF